MNKEKNLKVSKFFKANFAFNHIRRAGVVLYHKKEGQIYLIFGISNFFKKYTDFGGGVEFRERPNDAAIREFKEETLDIFNNISFEELKKLNIYYDDKFLLLYIEVTSDPNMIQEVFNQKKLNIDPYELEIEEIVYFPLEEIKKMLKEKKEFFYKPFYKILSKTINVVNF